jgi:hypothetical protein
MMATEIGVEARVLGERAEAGIGTVSVTLPTARLTGTELVRLVVEEQIRTLTVRRKLTAAEIERRLNRQYGTIAPENRKRELRIGVPEPDLTQEVVRALEACRAGQCLVVVDGQPVVDLEQEIVLQPETNVRFLRLLPLAGGQARCDRPHRRQ